MNARVLRRAAIALGLLAALLVVGLVGRLPGIGAEADPQGKDATGTSRAACAAAAFTVHLAYTGSATSR